MRAQEFPTNIQIETTSRCNAACTFCPYPETSLTQPQGVMDDDLFHKILDEIAQHRVHLIQPFLNNDPLMDKGIVPRLYAIFRAQPSALVRLTTNGTLLRRPIVEELARMPLETIHISSNGLTNSVYRNTMGLDGYTVLRNVNFLWDELQRRRSTTKLVVTAILLSANRDEVRHMHDYWKSRGVTFYLNPLNDRAGTIGAERFTQLLPFAPAVSRMQLQSYDMSGCPALYSYCGILWNGDVITCCMDWTRARVMGNVRENSIGQIWRNARYSHMRELSDTGRLAEEPLCRNCGENRFSIDTQILRRVLNEQNELGDLAVLDAIEQRRRENSDLAQLGLIRN